ncbi:polyphosphate--nucleotide phosphotransferase [Macrococcus hajekii]|uniref:Polyphosphate--nucleotide phosphotransferase n=1 Tax=Macrococcus hajekii TaxID=198482 RepID=A0A4R6BJR3_9STAP|nr:PPK2 family polyphosphate kinase [Macrococcus hajekii]TDM01935.1 polyphosphate--nucleotide phosphotransferase [Macrococcus hajekii]GGB08678.1 PPK2 family polyphosphate--nucleotide phosphotransferase [Macrococcus hajekii]
MNIENYKVPVNSQVVLSQYPTSEDMKKHNDDIREIKIPELVNTLKDLHLKLHAEEKKGILVVLQALDAAGKDETISYIFSNLNAQGLKTTSFKKPSEEESKHDYMWRLHGGLPARGEIGILNRSYYEEVIVTRVHDLIDDVHIPDDKNREEIWDVRYRQINDYEKYLTENGFHVVKFFFNMSKGEQRDRLLERMKNPKKNWEFSFNDVKEREYWDQYQQAFEDMLNQTSTEHSPWYVLPADDEWYARSLVSEIMINVLQEINPQFPEITGEEKEKLQEYIEKLENEMK